MLRLRVERCLGASLEQAREMFGHANTRIVLERYEQLLNRVHD
jgi:hypothetical protein